MLYIWQKINKEKNKERKDKRRTYIIIGYARKKCFFCVFWHCVCVPRHEHWAVACFCTFIGRELVCRGQKCEPWHDISLPLNMFKWRKSSRGTKYLSRGMLTDTISAPWNTWIWWYTSHEKHKITLSPQFESIKPSNTCLKAHLKHNSNLMKINSFKSIFITKIHAHPSKITHPYQNHYTPMPKHPYFSHTLSTLVHTKNQAQPCHKSPIISSHHFMQS